MDDLQIAEKEKTNAALSSVIAAVGLTAMKIVVGFLTGSLGILAEAAHSSLDLVAALVTLVAVRISGRPADREHLYGHGKIENLSALFETLLLLGTCVWIIYEAVERLFYKSVEVDPSIWAFLTMAVSIVIDYSRSRMLYAAARKYKSQALEADALHFSTDIWSSGVVIFGLTGVAVSRLVPGLDFLYHADAVAALGVALIVVYVSGRLGMRTIQGLLDQAPLGMVEKITRTVEALPGVVDCHNVRIRHSGPSLFVDAHVLVDGKLLLEQAHAMTVVIEQAIQSVAGDADVTVHPEPASIPPDDDEITSRITDAVEQLPGVQNCHHVHLLYAGSRLVVDSHVLIDGNQTLDQVHALTDQIEEHILKIVPGAEVTVHPEPAGHE